MLSHFLSFFILRDLFLILTNIILKSFTNVCEDIEMDIFIVILVLFINGLPPNFNNNVNIFHQGCYKNVF